MIDPKTAEKTSSLQDDKTRIKGKRNKGKGKVKMEMERKIDEEGEEERGIEREMSGTQSQDGSCERDPHLRLPRANSSIPSRTGRRPPRPCVHNRRRALDRWSHL